MNRYLITNKLPKLPFFIHGKTWKLYKKLASSTHPIGTIWKMSEYDSKWGMVRQDNQGVFINVTEGFISRHWNEQV